MAKRSTPKKKTCKSASKSRNAAFRLKATRKLRGKLARMQAIKKKLGGTGAKKKQKITKVKA